MSASSALAAQHVERCGCGGHVALVVVWGISAEDERAGGAGRGAVTGDLQDEIAKLRREIARLREYLHRVEDAETLEVAASEARLALYS